MTCYTPFMSSWYSSFVLDSGLNVLVAPLAVPSVTVAYIVKTGSKMKIRLKPAYPIFWSILYLKGLKIFFFKRSDAGDGFNRGRV